MSSKYGNFNQSKGNELSPYQSNSQNFNVTNMSNLNLNGHSQSQNFEKEKVKVKIKVAHKSKAGNNGGKTKTNQDSCLVKLNGLKLENFNLFSVMDGHGSHGHFISNSVKALFGDYIFKSSHYNLNLQTGN
jgi:hypothetical protein